MKKKKYYYLMITKDKYELPIFVADSLQELADQTGGNVSSIAAIISKREHGIFKTSSYIKVKRIEDDDE